MNPITSPHPNQPAPIALFVYNRPEHTRKTLSALAANNWADKSSLTIFSDAANNKSDQENVRAVRTLIHTISGFKEVSIIERQTNFGLSRNIIEGVSQLCEQEGRVIVLEDDIVTSSYFLEFMNAALKRYFDEPKVWHISGWNYPINTQDLDDAFFWRAMNCWGWATWSDRWRNFKKNPDALVKTWNSDQIKRFNLDGAYDFWRQIKGNHTGKINTWAIFWYASIFENGGLCLNPGCSFVTNIGLDGSGENCAEVEQQDYTPLATYVGTFPESYCESNLALHRISEYLMKSNDSRFHKKVYAKLKLIFGKLNN